MTQTIHGWKEFHWDSDGDLIFQERAVAGLVPHKEIPNHYHIKFEWRDEPTPEFFNLSNARDNARRIALSMANKDVNQARVEARRCVIS